MQQECTEEWRRAKKLLHCHNAMDFFYNFTAHTSARQTHSMWAH